MDYADISQIAQSCEKLSWNLFDHASWRSNEQRLINVVIETNVKHFCDDQKVPAENEAVIYLKDIFFFSVLLINYL